MSEQFDPSKQTTDKPTAEQRAEREAARQKTLEQSRRKSEQADQPVSESVKPRKSQPVEMHVDLGSDNPEEGNRLRVKMSDAAREEMRKTAEAGRQAAAERKQSDVQGMMESPSKPQSVDKPSTPPIPAKKSWFERLFRRSKD